VRRRTDVGAGAPAVVVGWPMKPDSTRGSDVMRGAPLIGTLKYRVP
jgi:hypothetical protein